MATPLPADGCQIKPVISIKPRAVSVNGVIIPRADIARETQNHPAAKPIEAWKAAARALVIRELLLQEARRLELRPTPLSDEEGRRETDEEALIRQVLEQEVVTPQPDEAICHRYYAQNKSRFRAPDLFEVAHILIPAGDDETQAAATADGILSLLTDLPDTFGDLARLYSACPSREVGGNLGQIGPGQTVPEFEKGIASAPVGRIAPTPVRSRYGYHIVRVDRRIEGQQLPFELVGQRIGSFLHDRVRAVAERQYVSLLAGRATIDGIEIEAAQSQLVQ